tara:strand:+ start:1779 stop:2414 length:636 start_codon:yes stop_codon:yes gene_type:complete
VFTPTIYIPNCDLDSDYITLDDSKLHHLKNVLRMKNEDNVNISNGNGKLFIGKLSKNDVKVSSKKDYVRNHETKIFVPPLREKNRFRFMIEKLVELNVSKLVIGKTENSQNTRIEADRISNWAISAVEQSGSPFFPDIEVTEEIDFSIFRTCFDISGEPINKDTDKVDTFAIGPEGGWSPKELTNFEIKYKIADFNLRSETAAVSAVSLIM